MGNNTKLVQGSTTTSLGNGLPDGARVLPKKLASISGYNDSKFNLLFVPGQKKVVKGKSKKGKDRLLCEREDPKTGRKKTVEPSKRLIETARERSNLPKGAADVLKEAIVSKSGGQESGNSKEKTRIFDKLEKTGKVFHAKNGVVVHIANAENAKQQKAKKGKGSRKPEPPVKCYDSNKKGPLSKREIDCGFVHARIALKEAKDSLYDKRQQNLIKKALNRPYYQIKIR